MLQVLQERGFADEEILAAASVKSVGKHIDFAGRKLTVISVEDAIAQRPHYAIFSAGASTSRQYAPLFAEVGCTVIDNSSCWRMNDNVPLVVPEINIDAVKPDHRIIANPNCSTIQMVLAVSRLHWKYRIKRLVISTYQSITGTGIKAVRQLQSEESYFAQHSVASSQLRPTMQQDLAEAYQLLDVIMGAQRTDGYTRQTFQTLTPAWDKILYDYTQKGGALLLSGAYLGTDLNTDSQRDLTSRILHCTPAGPERADSLLTIEGMNTQCSLLMQPNEHHLSTAYTSVLQPAGTAFSILLYPNSRHSAAVAYQGADYRAITLGFPIEQIQEDDTRRTLMAAFLKFLIK